MILRVQVALDEGPGPPIKYQYAELAKLYQVRKVHFFRVDKASVCTGPRNRLLLLCKEERKRFF